MTAAPAGRADDTASPSAAIAAKTMDLLRMMPLTSPAPGLAPQTRVYAPGGQRTKQTASSTSDNARSGHCALRGRQRRGA